MLFERFSIFSRVASKYAVRPDSSDFWGASWRFPRFNNLVLLVVISSTKLLEVSCAHVRARTHVNYVIALNL